MKKAPAAAAAGAFRLFLFPDRKLQQGQRLLQVTVEPGGRARQGLLLLIPVALLELRIAERPGQTRAEPDGLGVGEDAVEILDRKSVV